MEALLATAKFADFELPKQIKSNSFALFSSGNDVFYQKIMKGGEIGFFLLTVDKFGLTMDWVDENIDHKQMKKEIPGLIPYIVCEYPYFWIATKKGNFLKMDLNGEVVIDFMAQISPANFAVCGDILAIADVHGSMVVYSQGERAWKVDPDSLMQRLVPAKFVASSNKILACAVVGDHVFAITESGDLVAYAMLTGQRVGRWAQLGETLDGASLIYRGNILYLLMKTKSMCYVRSLDTTGTLKTLCNIIKPVIQMMVVDNDRIGLLSDNEIVIHNAIDFSFISRVVPPTTVSDITFADSGDMFMTCESGILTSRPMIFAEAAHCMTHEKTENTFIRVCKMVDAFLTPEEKNSMVLKPEVTSMRIVRKLRSMNFVIDASYSQIEAGLRDFCEIYVPITIPHAVQYGNVWASTMNQLTWLLYDYAVQILIALQYLEFNDLIEYFMPHFDNIKLCNFLRMKDVFPSAEFFGAPDASSFEERVRQQFGFLMDRARVCDYLIQTEKFTVLHDYANMIGSYYEVALSLFRTEKYDECIACIEDNEIEISNPEIIHEIFKALFKKARADLMARFISRLSDIADQEFPVIFLTFLRCGNMDEAFTYLSKCHDEGKKIDLFRYFVSYAMDNKRISTLFKFDFAKDTASFANELVCYSVRTLMAGALYFQKIGDMSEAAATLYLYARSMLRSASRKSLSQASSALALCLSITEDNECVIRNVSDNSLVDRKDIVRLARKVECLLDFNHPEDYVQKSNGDILIELYKIKSRKLDTFCKLVDSDALAVFCKYLVEQKGFEELESILKNCDKRTWGYKLHKKTLETFLVKNFDPPVWFIDRMLECAPLEIFKRPDDIARSDRKIVTTAVQNLYHNKQKISRHMIPYIRQVREIPDSVIAAITE